LNEHHRLERRRTWFGTIEEMQRGLDDHLVVYNHKRPHQGRGRTPAQAFKEGLPKPAQPPKEMPAQKTANAA
jgi:transposase InsO family protein